jgi:uncharacterized protein YfaS (alpha-2-macroglobulin family)
VPSLTVAVEKPQYARGETVNITGSLKENDVPQAGVTVNITVTDPTNAETSVSAQTDASGNYLSSWVVPDTAPGGSFTVSATALGTTATTTFRFSKTP